MKNKTNIEFVSDMMNFSNHGALAQLFIVEAIIRYADQVAEAKPEQLKMGFINPKAWVAVAKEIKSKMEEKYVDNEK